VTNMAEQEHLNRLLEIYQRNLRLLEQLAANAGSEDQLPTGRWNELNDTRRKVAELQLQLGAELEETRSKLTAVQIKPNHLRIALADTHSPYEGRATFQDATLAPVVPPEVLQFLPHLANRTPQKDSLYDLLRRLDRHVPRPVVCLIHGDEHQAQDMFLERLKKYILPELLDVPEDLAITEYALSWPDRYSAARSFPQLLPRRIAEAVQAADDATLTELNAQFAARRAPVMLSTFLLTQDWMRHGIEELHTFVRFWQRWPSLSPGQVLLVCLFITYQVRREGGFFARWPLQRTNAELTATVEALARERFDGIIHGVLPRLEGIERGEVEHWARSTETCNICPREEIIDGIRAIYQSWEKKEHSIAIPMDDLAKELRKLLSKYTGQRREFA
jgi:hypothetical protein